MPFRFNCSASWPLLPPLLCLVLASHSGPGPAVAAPVPVRVTASYAALLDPGEIVRDGRPLLEARTDPRSKGMVQPFLAPWSRLLPTILEMAGGPSSSGFDDLSLKYPPGDPQPAWAAVLREGRVLLTADGAGKARVFLPGDSAKGAYDRWYPFLRLPLASLLPPDGSGLSLEVYPYRNRYAEGELSLSLSPLTLRARSFSPRQHPLDMQALQAFFSRGVTLEGGRLDPLAGLVLYGRPGEPQILAGRAPTLADLAVAWRAMAFSGDNPPFVSLDPHRDPLRTRVNFGGLLEDTPVGKVVLEADKRFKTITTGVDPDTFADRRQAIRQEVPGWMSSGEREFLQPVQGGWVSTRLWFYPESVRVETDPAQTVARIVDPRFRADAERQLGDFPSVEEYEKRRKGALAPSIRANIEDLNRRYPAFQRAIPEFGELTTVARLMGLAAWLARSPAATEYDLASLLAVELPAFHTERERERLITLSALPFAGTVRRTPATVSQGTMVSVLDTLPGRRVGEIFPSERDFREAWKEAPPLGWDELRERPAREIIAGEEDLRRVVQAATIRVRAPTREEIQRMGGEIENDRAEMAGLEREIRAMGPPATPQDAARYNGLAQRFNQALARVELARSRMRDAMMHGPTVTEITGGIDLAPGSFALKPQGKRLSPALREMAEGKGWISSDSLSTRPRPAAGGGHPVLPPSSPPSTPLPSAAPHREAGKSVEPPPPSRPPPTPRTVGISGFPGVRPGGTSAVGKMDPGGRIVFTLAPPPP